MSISQFEANISLFKQDMLLFLNEVELAADSIKFHLWFLKKKKEPSPEQLELIDRLERRRDSLHSAVKIFKKAL